jgi:hypothetical protein
MSGVPLASNVNLEKRRGPGGYYITLAGLVLTASGYQAEISHMKSKSDEEYSLGFQSKSFDHQGGR